VKFLLLALSGLMDLPSLAYTYRANHLLLISQTGIDAPVCWLVRNKTNRDYPTPKKEGILNSKKANRFCPELIAFLSFTPVAAGVILFLP